jgi:hypothetical protein
MNSLLLIIEFPKLFYTDEQKPHRHGHELDWLKLSDTLLSTAPKDAKIPNIQLLAPNVFLFDADHALPFLTTALARAGDLRFPCRILSLDEHALWIQ